MQRILHLVLAYSFPLVALVCATLLVIFNHPFFSLIPFIICFLTIPLWD